ncbi:hypothetical protein D3C72_953880 [compost metagenome]
MVALVADGVGGDLDAGAQGLLIQRHDRLARRQHQAGRVGAIRIGLEQLGPARAQGAVGVELDRPGDDPPVARVARPARHQGAGVAHVDAVVDPKRRLALARHLLQQGHVLPRCAHEVDAGPAVAGIDAEPGAIGGPRRRRVGLRRQRIDQNHGPVDQQTGRLAVGVLQDLAARGGGRRRIDPGCGQSRAGGRDGMAVGPAQKHHPTGGGGVQIGGGQEALLWPVGFDPAAPDDDALGVSPGPVAQPRHGLDDRGRAFQVQRHLTPAYAVQMGVAVSEAGEEGGALQIDDLHVGGARHRRFGAHRHDPSVADDHLPGGRLGGVAGVDGPAMDQQVLRKGRRRGGGHQAGGQRQGLHQGADHGASEAIKPGGRLTDALASRCADGREG